MNTVVYEDNLAVLRQLPNESVHLVYVDPPFNTGKIRDHQRIKTTADSEGDRTGFGGKRYTTQRLVDPQYYDDDRDDYLAFLEPRLMEARRVLTHNGTLYVHLDWHEVHYVKALLLDEIFGRECFLNEIIWAYDYGGKSKKKWPAKHDNILVYVKDPKNYVFNSDAVDREPYMAPGLVTPEKVARGKLPTDVWWHTIVPTNGSERTGYPTQKPLGILKRIITASSNPGDTVLDFFAGSGTTGEAAYRLSRHFIMVDDNPTAIAVMVERFGNFEDMEWLP